MIGTTLDGKYQIRKLLGEGAMGSVYEAEHTATGRRVAVKVISSADLTKDPKVVSRFQREARAAGAIETQHITQVLDAGVDRESNLPFLVMEYMVGDDLMALIKRVGALSPDLVLRIGAQACLGLQKAHAANVVHRDIKPHNLFLARREAGEVVVKLLDFGIAKVKMDQAHDTENAELTRTGNLLGSPLYMSPEQARGQKEIDARTDIWSLGAVMYQALTGRTPYHHINALGELIISICSVPPPPVQDFAPWVPPEVAAIVHNCLQQDPGRRYQSADQLLAAIRALLPYGWAIQEEMLISLQDSMRQQAAPRLPLSMPPPRPEMSSSPGLVSGPPRGSSPALGSSPGLGYAHAGATTTEALTQSQGLAPAKSSKAPLVISLVALATVVVGGLLLFSRTEPQPAQTAPPPAQTQAPVAAPKPEPTPTPAPTPTPEVEAKPRRVRLTVEPKDVTVVVESNGVPVKDVDFRNGLLEFNGVLGGEYRVKLSKAKNESVETVVMGESGPNPPRLELRPPGAPKPAATATPGGAAPAPAPKPQGGVIEDTGEFGN
ncbi:serine/threonine protein kinase [Chondromyces apiculatus]|uniref:Serine/threonine-protein kinase pkn3 n=1 Tax=Chondromyces apiculatus DSM 436 TaxID=1192034 RepID=A0A017TFE1_9BACT|nr:serine/threonine-protein kinase [Chondromyces apiculatus]EYF07622.1 Serine/threonine-protein kinase pkn3 [Chondromyces apiculatus DSM 436]